MGETGAVFKALHISKRQTYALKLFQGGFLPDDPTSHSFIKKLTLAQAIKHRHIARTYPIEEADPLRMLPMEFVYGQSVSTKIAEGPAGIDFTLRFALQAAEALDTIEQSGMVHGQITSNTLLITSDGDLKVLEFGLRELPQELLFRSVDPESSFFALMPAPRPTLSRFAYRAPEQVLGEAVSARSDLFSIGVVIYELLVGQFLFEGDNREELERQILERDLPRVHHMRPDASTDWTKVLCGLLEKDPANRYPSAQALLEDLHRLNYGAKLDHLSFQSANPRLSRRSFFRRFVGDRGEEL